LRAAPRGRILLDPATNEGDGGVSLRLRVVLVSVVATALVVVLAGATLLALVSRDQRAELDERLVREAAELARPALLAASFGEGRLVRGERRFDFGVAARLTVGGDAVAATESFPTLPTV